jgi:C_GCAxxG_C_C family probable redox protein
MEAWKESLETRRMPPREATYDILTTPPASREKILDAIASQAFISLEVYGNCCRSTLWAIQTHLRCMEAAPLRASAVLAGGIAGTGETCGAVLGGLLAIGEVMATDDLTDQEQYAVANATAKQFVDKIIAQYGSTRCHLIQEAIIGWRCDDPSKARAWQDAGGPTACAGVCATAARLAACLLLDREAKR